MVDIVDKPTRSKMMSGIRSKDTGLEKRLRSALHRIGLRFRKHRRDLPGTPDIVFPRWNAAVEVHGCFWHRHEGCPLSANPDDMTGKWAAKFDANVSRDRRNKAELRKLGWRVAIVWECAVRTHGDDVVAGRIAEWLRGDQIFAEFGVE
jgi:DNA mismatch endonuclease (patch repair protein)